MDQGFALCTLRIQNYTSPINWGNTILLVFMNICCNPSRSQPSYFESYASWIWGQWCCLIRSSRLCRWKKKRLHLFGSLIISKVWLSKSQRIPGWRFSSQKKHGLYDWPNSWQAYWKLGRAICGDWYHWGWCLLFERSKRPRYSKTIEYFQHRKVLSL